MNVSNARGCTHGNSQCAGEANQAEFLEMPGQAQRLWGLDAKACDDALKALVEGAFLHRTASGAYSRR